MLRFEDLRVRDQQELDRDFFNRRFRLIAETFGQLGQEVASVTGDTDRLVALGLTRVNEVLGPLLSKVQAVSENGFLVATSATSLTIANGLQSTLAITDPAQRDLFSPTPYVLLTRQADGTQDDYAVLRVEDFNRTNGGLAFEVILVNGNIGDAAHEDWVISATAGISVAVLEAATSVQATLALAEQAASDAADAGATAQSVLASGPVSSVNGKTGAVVLGMSDIAGLVGALAAKAESTHGHTIAQVSNLQATLNVLADGGTY
jgi:hypothetical protein